MSNIRSFMDIISEVNNDKLIGQIVDKEHNQYNLFYKLDDGVHIFSLKYNGLPAGIALINAGDNYIDDVTIASEFQRKGVGTSFYDAIQKYLKVTLVPNPDFLTTAAQSLWKRRLAK